MRSILLTASLLPIALCAQITVTTGPGNGQQAWFNLLNETTTARPLAEWDLAFEINGGFSAGVLVNTAKGHKVYQAPYTVADFAVVDTTGMALGWAQLQNSDTAWGAGTLNQHISGELDLGWGVYNMITHVVVGDSVFVVKKSDGTCVKIKIDALSGGTYTFTTANLDGSGEVNGSIAKADYPERNFAYWSFDTNAALDREPANDGWDLLFTKYLTDVGIWYGVTGVLHNKQVEVARVDDAPSGANADPWAVGFDHRINTIGSDWKYFDMGTFTYVIDDSLTYFVKDVPGNVWKIVFTAFGGAATGDITFTKELLSAATIPEPTATDAPLLAWPNPAHGTASVLVDVASLNAELSLVDRTGRVVRSERVAAGLQVRTLDLAGLPAGLYALVLNSTTEQRSITLSVE